MTSSTSHPEASAESGTVSRPGGLRQLGEAIICLCLAVIVFRTFEVEGYMISTGSMAPSLWGYHKRVVCPTCGYEFAVGDAFDDEDESRTVAGTGDSAVRHEPETCVCPNCGQEEIDIADVPRSQGDQLLVHKNAFRFHPPRRWETAVFRNPQHPLQAYVKRVIGLPGESVRVVAGDIWIDGEPARKDFLMQRAVRIPVFDLDSSPEPGSEWETRWRPDAAPIAWERTGDGFSIDNTSLDAAASDDSVAWVTYRHWIRSGGSHVTRISIPRWPDGGDPPTTSFLPVHYDDEEGMLYCTGVLSETWFERLTRTGADADLIDHVKRLRRQSHFAPVTDVYGYNRLRGEGVPVFVPDLMFSAQVQATNGHGRFGVRMTDGEHRYDLVLDLGAQEAHLWVDDEERPARSAPIAAGLLAEPTLVEMSLFDRQVSAMVGDVALFEPLLLEASSPAAKPPSSPVRFGARSLSVRVTELMLYRDIHYREDSPRTARHAIGSPCELGSEEYFVLGDNSPVSADSRCWPSPAVHRRLFLGKPFLVHLPSRPGRIRIGRRTAHIRIPDISRIRYIR